MKHTITILLILLSLSGFGQSSKYDSSKMKSRYDSILKAANIEFDSIYADRIKELTTIDQSIIDLIIPKCYDNYGNSETLTYGGTEYDIDYQEGFRVTTDSNIENEKTISSRHGNWRVNYNDHKIGISTDHGYHGSFIYYNVSPQIAYAYLSGIKVIIVTSYGDMYKWNVDSKKWKYVPMEKRHRYPKK